MFTELIPGAGEFRTAAAWVAPPLSLPILERQGGTGFVARSQPLPKRSKRVEQPSYWSTLISEFRFQNGNLLFQKSGHPRLSSGSMEVQYLPMAMKPVRYQRQRCLHFVTFSCYHRMKLLDSAAARDTFEHELDRVRRWYGCYIVGYVVMPEHVHLLISEPERSELSVVLQMLKQITSRKLKVAGLPHFWQVRYYSFPVWSEKKRLEKLRNIHRNRVERGLVERPEDWRWSSFNQWASGVDGQVYRVPNNRAEARTSWRDCGDIPPCRKKRDKGGATDH